MSDETIAREQAEPTPVTWHRLVEIAKEENQKSPSQAISVLLEQVDFAETFLVRGASGMNVDARQATDLALSAKGSPEALGISSSGRGVEHAVMVEKSRAALCVAVRALNGALRDRGYNLFPHDADFVAKVAGESP